MRTFRNAMFCALALGTVVAVAPAPYMAANGAPAPLTPPPATAPFDVSQLDDATLAEVMVRFVAFYLSGEDLDASQIEAVYAPHVAYFGETLKLRDAITRDKMRYYRRWPQRRYDIVPDTMQVFRDGDQPNLIDVTFEYKFDLRGPGRRSRGIGRAEITLDFSTSGGLIVREQGEVLKRG